MPDTLKACPQPRRLVCPRCEAREPVTNKLLAACKAIDESAAPYRASDMSPERTYIVGRKAMKAIRVAITEAEKLEGRTNGTD